MNWILAIFAIFVVTLIGASIMVRAIQAQIPYLIDNELIQNPPKDIEKEWYDLSWSGENPLRVVALAFYMITMTKTKMTSVEEWAEVLVAEKLTSAYYSQVKHLIKRKQILSAIAFFLESIHWSKKTSLLCDEIWQKGHKSENYIYFWNDVERSVNWEVVGAPWFALATIPFVGRWFRRKAITYLHKEESNDLRKKKDSLGRAIIAAKLYTLTKDRAYSDRISQGRLIEREMDANQLTRIAKHLGFKTKEELFKFCSI
jgi:hypothetical protein